MRRHHSASSISARSSTPPATLARRAVAVLLLVGSFMAGSVEAVASTGTDVGQQPDPSASDLARAIREAAPIHARKEAMFALHARAMATNDWTAFNAAADTLNLELTGGRAARLTHGVNPTGPGSDALYQYRVLTAQQYPQLAWNWCGPAAGQAVVYMWSQNIAATTVPSQSQMHTWMNTGPAGGPGNQQPGTDITWFTSGLNTALGTSYYGVTTNLSQQGSAWFWDAVTGNIDANWSAGVNTTETGTTTYNGHFNGNAPSQSGHYIAPYGYYNVFSPGGFYFLDSAGNASPSLGWSSATTFSYDSPTFFDNFMNYDLNGRGLVW
jgi:Peptidase_C39 like family